MLWDKNLTFDRSIWSNYGPRSMINGSEEVKELDVDQVRMGTPPSTMREGVKLGRK